MVGVSLLLTESALYSTHWALRSPPGRVRWTRASGRPHLGARPHALSLALRRHPEGGAPSDPLVPSSLWGVVWRRGTPMIRGAGGARSHPPSLRSYETASGRIAQVEYAWSRRVKIALDGSREFPPTWAVFPLFSYDGFGCRRLARSADRAVPVELGRFLACAVERRAFLAGANPARQWSLQPEAARAVHGGDDMS